MVFVGSCSCQFPFWFFTAHWILYMKGMGISPSVYAFAMGIFVMGSIFGRLIGGWLMDKISARYAFMLGLCCYFIGSILAMNLTKDTMFMVYAAGVLYGAAFGWSWVCLQTTTGNFFGIKAYPKLNGTILMLSGIICSPAAIIGGKLFDIFKSYHPTFMLNMVVAAVGIIALFFAKMPVLKRDNCSISSKAITEPIS
jgi:MFS family permease